MDAADKYIMNKSSSLESVPAGSVLRNMILYTHREVSRQEGVGVGGGGVVLGDFTWIQCCSASQV